MTESIHSEPAVRATFDNPRRGEYELASGPWYKQDLAALLRDAPVRDELICGMGVRLSTAELIQAVWRTANWLHTRGVGAGDAVSWQLANSPDAVVAYLATWYVGALAVPWHEGVTLVEIRKVLSQVGGRLLLLADAGLPLAAHPDAVHLPSEGLDALTDGTELFDPRPDCRPADPAVLLTTSGSSGRPKTVIHSHRSLAYKARQLATLHGTSVADAVLVPASLAHMAGLLHAVLHPLGAGVKAVIMPRWNADAGLTLVRDEKITMLFGPPIFALGIAAAAQFTPSAVASIRLISSGSTAISEAYVEKVRTTFGAAVKRTYGSTEAPVACTALPGDDPQLGWRTDGRPVRGLELEIRDPGGTVLPAGSPGEIWLRGPELCDGYLDPQQTADTFVDGWMRTRDVGTMDSEGFLTVSGRISGFIIRGGMNISGREIELALEAHPAIRQAVVLGYPDDVYGERVAAFIVADTDFDRAKCMTWFAQHGVARYKVPDRFERLNAIPTLASFQKPDLQSLRERL